MNISSFALALAVLLTGSSVRAVQDRSASGRVQLPEPILGNCEDNIGYLSNAHQMAGSDSTVIAIARLGNGERSRELNRRRLHNVRIYLTEFDWRRAPETIVTAQGDPVKGHGRVELYVKGELFAILAVKRNQDLLVGSCEPDSIRPVAAERNLYPYLEKKARRKKP